MAPNTQENPNFRRKPRQRERRTKSEDSNVLRACVDAYGAEEAGFMDDGNSELGMARQRGKRKGQHG
jgi:hypothetical protein